MWVILFYHFQVPLSNWYCSLILTNTFWLSIFHHFISRQFLVSRVSCCRVCNRRLSASLQCSYNWVQYSSLFHLVLEHITLVELSFMEVLRYGVSSSVVTCSVLICVTQLLLNSAIRLGNFITVRTHRLFFGSHFHFGTRSYLTGSSIYVNNHHDVIHDFILCAYGGCLWALCSINLLEEVSLWNIFLLLRTIVHTHGVILYRGTVSIFI
jgi:hypothetical protein